MDILIIVLLVILAIFLVVVETLLLPGMTIAAIGALAAGMYASFLAYSLYGLGAGLTVFMGTLVLSVVTVLVCIKKRTITKLSLKVNSDSAVPSVRDTVKIGEQGVATSRLAPIGTILVNGNYVEAKSVGGFVDPKSVVKVTGYEDNLVLIEKI